jgi:NADP-dependent 3-hydroxy acid dehydrogenase YdfG
MRAYLLLVREAAIIQAMTVLTSFIGPIVDWTPEKAKDLYDTNVVSIIRMCGAVFPHMAQRKSGTIVNIGSIVGEL